MTNFVINNCCAYSLIDTIQLINKNNMLKKSPLSYERVLQGGDYGKLRILSIYTHHGT